MDESIFQKELSKYKVVRQPDYYKNRVKNVTRFNKPSTITNSVTKDSNVSNSAQAINPNESNFWELFSAVNSNVLTTAESMKFTETLKLVRFILYFFYKSLFISANFFLSLLQIIQEHDAINSKVSLYDLEAIAASILKGSGNVPQY